MAGATDAAASLPSPSSALQRAIVAADGSVLDTTEALQALAGLGEVALGALDRAEEAAAEAGAREDAEPEPIKPQRLTPTLIASRCLSPDEASASRGADALAEQLMGLTRLRLDRLRLDSMDGLDICSGSATHLQLQHNLLTCIDGLEFFDQLQYLVVAHNQLTDLSGVSHLRKLLSLDASCNRIARVDAKACLPPQLLSLELSGNPCAGDDDGAASSSAAAGGAAGGAAAAAAPSAAAGSGSAGGSAGESDYRRLIIRGLPKLLYLDEVRISNRERRLAGGEGAEGLTEADDESSDEDDDDEEEDEEEEEGDEAEAVGGDGAATAGGEEEGQQEDGAAALESSSYLSGAKAHVEQQLREVDALLASSGYDLKSPSFTPRPTSRGDDRLGGDRPAGGGGGDGGGGDGGGGADAMDTDALYKKALELYGVNADVQSTQAKIRAIQERTRQRRREFASQAHLLPPEFAKGADSRPGTATSSSAPSID
jgi:hypothetical protein